MNKKNNKIENNAKIEELEYKKATFRVNDVEEDSVIINVSGWRMRVDVLKNKKADIKELDGKLIEFEYSGNIENPIKDTPKFKPIKI